MTTVKAETTATQDGEHLKRLVAELEANKRDLEARRFVEQNTARFTVLMRRNDEESFGGWVDRLTEELARMANALQVALYLRTETESGVVLQTVGGYALSRQTREKTTRWGEGLLGQAARSGRLLFFSGGARIDASAGTATSLLEPRSLIVLPLKYNDRVEGVLEITTPHDLAPHELDLLKNVGEYLAAGLTSVRAQEEMLRLYQEAQQKTEQLQTQEEEMRQNVEELQATQEEMKEQQLMLAEREARLNAFINNTDDFILIVDKSLTLILTNEPFAQVIRARGKSIEPGQTHMRDIVQPHQWDAALSHFKRGFDGEPSIQKLVIQRGEKTIYQELSYNPIRTEKGGVTSVSVVIRDITAATLQAQKVRESETRLQSFIDNTTDAIYLVDTEYIILLANRQVTEDYAARGMQITPGVTRLQELMTAEQFVYYKALYDRTFKGEEVFDETHTKNQDVETYLEVKYTPVKNLENKIIACATVARNVTQTKNAEISLKKNAALTTALLNSTDDFIFAYDLDYKIIVFNEALRVYAQEKLGLNLTEECSVWDFYRHLPHVLFDERRKAYSAGLKGETFSVEFHYPTPDGEIIFYEDAFHPIYNEGKIVGCSVFIRDVSERNKQDKLLESHNQEHNQLINVLHAIINHLPVALFVKDGKDLRFVEWNNMGETFFGLKREDAIGKTDYDFFPKEEADFFTETDRAIFESGQRRIIPEETITTPAGERLFLRTTKVPVYTEDGKPHILVGICENITDIKLREQEANETQTARETYETEKNSLTAELERCREKIAELERALAVRDGGGSENV